MLIQKEIARMLSISTLCTQTYKNTFPKLSFLYFVASLLFSSWASAAEKEDRFAFITRDLPSIEKHFTRNPGGRQTTVFSQKSNRATSESDDDFFITQRRTTTKPKAKKTTTVAHLPPSGEKLARLKKGWGVIFASQECQNYHYRFPTYPNPYGNNQNANFADPQKKQSHN